MRKLLSLVPALPFIIATASAQQNSQSQKTQKTSLPGRWVVSADFYGTLLFFPLELSQQDGKLHGKFGQDELEGTLSGNSLHFLAKDERGGTEDCNAVLVHTKGQPNMITGTLVFAGTGDDAHAATHQFTAKPVPERRAGAAKRHEFKPNIFHRQFSAANKPVLTVRPGDTVHTTTVGCGRHRREGRNTRARREPGNWPFLH